MPLTGALGTIISRLGQVQPGYVIVQGKAQWLGPFAARVDAVPGLPTMNPGDTITVGVPLAAELAASDPAWWGAH